MAMQCEDEHNVATESTRKAEPRRKGATTPVTTTGAPADYYDHEGEFENPYPFFRGSLRE